MVRQGLDSLLLQEFGGLFNLLARQAIHNAGVARMLALDEVEQLLATVGLLDNLVADIGAVKRGNETRALLQLQTQRDFLTGLLVGGRRQRNPRHLRETLVQDRQLDVFGPEIMAPL